MAVGLGQSAPCYLELEPLGMVRRTVRKVRETRRNPSDADEGSLPTLIRDGGFEDRDPSTDENSRTVRDASIAHSGEQFYAVRRLSYPYPGVSLRVRLEVGHTYRLIFWVMVPTTAPEAQDVYWRYDTKNGDGTDRWKFSVKKFENDGLWRKRVWDTTIDGDIPIQDTALWLQANGTREDPEAWVYFDDASVMDLGTYFDGDTPNADGWEYRWEGAPNNSTSIAERVEYVDEYGTIADGAPHVRITVYNVEGTESLRLERTAGGETQTVQGATSMSVTDIGIITDWVPPLNRETTYTVLADGEPQHSATITIGSETSWLQDPLDPTTALPVYLRGTHQGALTLYDDSLATSAHSVENTQIMVLGSKYPRYYGGQRQAAQGVKLGFYSDDEDTSDQFAAMIDNAPILVFRTARKLRPLPPVAYIAGDTTQEQVDQDEGPNLGATVWTIEANLVQAVLQAAQTGYITYGQVQDLLGGYTYGEVQTAAANTLYLDWQKNPLIFRNL